MNDSRMPTFLRAAGHTVRWRLLGELAASDRQVHELTARLGEAQNLVSYHLSQLRQAGPGYPPSAAARTGETCTTASTWPLRRDARHAGGALHPALRLTVPQPAAVARARRRVRVLFLCTGNSSRSQMAEALLRHRAGGAVTVKSAGSQPKPCTRTPSRRWPSTGST